MQDAGSPIGGQVAEIRSLIRRSAVTRFIVEDQRPASQLISYMIVVVIVRFDRY